MFHAFWFWWFFLCWWAIMTRNKPNSLVPRQFQWAGTAKCQKDDTHYVGSMFLWRSLVLVTCSVRYPLNCCAFALLHDSGIFLWWAIMKSSKRNSLVLRQLSDLLSGHGLSKLMLKDDMSMISCWLSVYVVRFSFLVVRSDWPWPCCAFRRLVFF